MTTTQRVDVERLSELLARATPGPWRWEYNQLHKGVEIAGGRPEFDKTVMDFTRWGMRGAQPRFNDGQGCFRIMHKLADRPEWIAPFPGREHHANWCADVAHPDAALMVAAVNALPALLQQLADYDELGETITMMGREIADLKMQVLAAERAREEAHGLLRDVIAWRRTVPIDETPNRKDGGIFGRIAAFLAANAPTHSAGGE